ncbi:Uncharacterised protein, partial [Metamycoplasma alkalescens]
MKIKFNKKKFFLAAGLFLFSSTILITAIVVKNQIIKQQNNQVQKNDSEYISVLIDGAIEYPGEYSFKKGSTYLELFNQAILKSKADLQNLDKNQLLKDNEKIYVPFLKNQKLKLNEITSYQTLVELGIKSHLAQKVYSYLKKREIRDW